MLLFNRKLRARIDALQDEGLKRRILRAIKEPRWRRITDEEIFEKMVERHNECVAQRTMRDACSYRWRDEELVAFLEYFKKHRPQWYADYLHQERNGREIDGDLADNMRRLVLEWLPGVGWNDGCRLFGMVRDHAHERLV
jgi:hypothetical protein